MRTKYDADKVQSLLEFFIWMVANKYEIQLSNENIEFDFDCGICHNVCEFTEDHSEKILQKLFRNYFKIPDCYFVPDYPFATGNSDPTEEYRQTPNKYLDTEYGNLRWTFIEWAIEELTNNGKRYIDD
ncbi:hypothetical protein Presley_39 [Acinetobacter phage Presley]|uniref:Uncharacterized protein n=1 Tax=Acinetobacter phage Presley TaxID=1406780 RepID=U5PWI3_9CAUD|nr:hypothetical protein Presley_39 [Acinetobacter phage Presley]AGY48106.1 hypothetical protein Presley_39 [Acinetobacter phage Presley]